MLLLSLYEIDFLYFTILLLESKLLSNNTRVCAWKMFVYDRISVRIINNFGLFSLLGHGGADSEAQTKHMKFI